jgi:hypothetical protein
LSWTSSACFLAYFASSTFSIPDLRPQPDSATQTAIQTMANLRFVLGAAFVFVGLLIPCVFSR